MFVEREQEKVSARCEGEITSDTALGTDGDWCGGGSPLCQLANIVWYQAHGDTGNVSKNMLQSLPTVKTICCLFSALFFRMKKILLQVYSPYSCGCNIDKVWCERYRTKTSSLFKEKELNIVVDLPRALPRIEPARPNSSPMPVLGHEIIQSKRH